MSEMDSESLRIWCPKRWRIAKRIVCAMHISGGPPCRGTEIGVNSVRQRVCGKKTPFFLGPKCVIVPHYDKTGNLKAGEVPFLAGHLNYKTTFILKAFLIFVHPGLIANGERLDEEQAMKRLPEEARILAHDCNWEASLSADEKSRRSLRRDILCAEEMSPSTVSMYTSLSCSSSIINEDIQGTQF